MIDILATMTPQEYRTVKTQLQAEGLWEVGGDRNRERRANAAAEQIIKRVRN